MIDCEPLCVCSRCGLTGYYLTDVVRNLCHNCVRIEKENAPHLETLQAILTRFVQQDCHPSSRSWQCFDFAKAFCGNSILGAIESAGGDRHEALGKAMQKGAKL